jgi:hypothetical protein
MKLCAHSRLVLDCSSGGVRKQELFSQAINAFANWGKGKNDRKYAGANAGKGRFGIGAEIVRRMNNRIRKKSEYSEEQGRSPSIGKVSRIASKCEGESRKNGEQAGLGGECKMGKCNLGEVALDHKHEANRSRLNGLMPTEHNPVLMFFIHEVASFSESPLAPLWRKATIV